MPESPMEWGLQIIYLYGLGTGQRIGHLKNICDQSWLLFQQKKDKTNDNEGCSFHEPQLVVTGVCFLTFKPIQKFGR